MPTSALHCVAPSTALTALLAFGACGAQAVTPNGADGTADANVSEGDGPLAGRTTSSISIWPLPTGDQVGAFFGPHADRSIITLAPCVVETRARAQSDLNPGPLTIAWRGTTLTTYPSPDGLGYGVASSSDTLMLGDTITASAPGASLRAFTQSIVYPSPLVLVHPSPSLSLLAIDSTQPLTVTWQPAPGSTAYVVLGCALSAVPGLRVAAQCAAPSTAGSMVIPASVLQLLAPSAGASGCRFGWQSRAEAVFPLGSEEVYLAAQNQTITWTATVAP